MTVLRRLRNDLALFGFPPSTAVVGDLLRENVLATRGDHDVRVSPRD